MPSEQVTIKPTKKRVTRSISFKTNTLKSLVSRAKKERRSVNWLVNEAVRRELGSE